MPRTLLRRALTAAACLVVFAALLLPNTTARLTPVNLLRIPLEALAVAGLLIVVRGRARTITAGVLGGVLGLLTVEKALDMGFRSALARQFDPVLDWSLLDDGYGFVRESYGTAVAIGAAAAAVLLALLIMAALVGSTIRVSRLLGAHRKATVRAGAAAAVAWAACLLLGAQVGGVPVAARSTATYAYDRVLLAKDGFTDKREFAREVSTDAFRDVPGDRLLTGLAGKQVLVAFVESYGRSALEDPAMAVPLGRTLDEGTRRLAAKGWQARSGWLTSPTAGGGSWLAHATLLSGVWIDNQQRYGNLLTSGRLTLPGAFRKAGRTTAAVEPGNAGPWPAGELYNYEQVYDSTTMGYRGPQFGWSRMPDQYALEQFRRKNFQGPLFAEITLTSSHTPWAPIPRLVGWDEIGDGSIYTGIKAAEGRSSGSVWKNPADIRNEYRKSVAYSVNTLASYLDRFGTDDLVLVFLGDHQPSPVVAGENASRDVPITVVAKDPAVLAKIQSWSWTEGLKPAPDAPVWRMDAFRDRFLTAYGPDPAQ